MAALASSAATAAAAAILLKEELARSAKKLKEKLAGHRMDAIPEDAEIGDEGFDAEEAKKNRLKTLVF